MRKLTIINQQYPPEVVSTGQIFRVMAEYLAVHDWDVTVAAGTPYYPGQTEKVPRRETAGGVHIRRLRNTTFDKKRFLGKLLNLITYQASLLFFCIFSIGRDQTVLVATAPPLAVVSAAVGRFFRGYRIVMTVQDLYPDAMAASGMQDKSSLLYRLLQWMMRRAMHACDRVITISTDMQRHLEAAYGLTDVIMIPNLFPETICPVDAAQAKAVRGWQDRLVVQYSGNFGVAHEYETLLGAVRLLRDDAGILFQITGAGRHYDALQAACEAEGLRNIVFEGYALLDALEEHLGTADISIVVFDASFRDVLLPSKYYGILASGRGTLLISGAQSDISRDIVTEGIGLVFDHGQSEALAEALVRLKADPEVLRAMGQKARELYDARYAQEPILEAYDEVLGAVARCEQV